MGREFAAMGSFAPKEDGAGTSSPTGTEGASPLPPPPPAFALTCCTALP